MSAESKQLQMLREYAQALEKQNQSRNTQKDILIKQIDRLSHECQHLHQAHAKCQQVTQQLEALQGRKGELERVLNQVRVQLEGERLVRARLEEQLSNKIQPAQAKAVSEDGRAPTDAGQLRGQIENLGRLLGEKQLAIKVARQQNQAMKQKIAQLQRKSLTESSQFQKLRLTRETQFRTRQNYLSNQLSLKDRTISELSEKLQKAEMQSNNAGRSSQARDLKFKIADLESKLNLLERQKTMLVQKNRELEVQITHKDSLLILRKDETIEIDKLKRTIYEKDEQIIKATLLIQNLQDKLKLAEEKIKALEARLHESSKYESDYMKKIEDKNRQDSRYKQQLERLKQYVNSQEANFNKIIEYEKSLNADKQRQARKLKQLINQLTETNTGLLDKVDRQHQTPASVPTQQSKLVGENEPNDLRELVLSLKQEIGQLKSNMRRQHSPVQLDPRRSQARVKNTSYQQLPSLNLSGCQSIPRYISPASINQASPVQQSLSSVTPKYRTELTRKNGSSSRVRTLMGVSGESDGLSSPKAGNNQDKWQNLQKRIAQLREENEQLKQSLLY